MIDVVPGTFGYRLADDTFLSAAEFIHRDFVFQQHVGIPVPHTKPVDAHSFYLTEPVRPAKRTSKVWYIVGVRVPVPCLDITLWYNGQREVTLAPAAPDVLYPVGPIAVAPGLPVRIDQEFGLYGAPRPCTHVLTLAGYFLRDELYAPPAHEGVMVEAVRPPC